MNSNFMLQNFVQNSTGFNFADQSKPKKSSKGNQHELELHIGITYNEVCQMLEDNDVRLHSNEDTIRAADKISMFKTIVEHLISQLGQASPSRQQCEDSNIISCPDCQTYETSLQKLENQVRQHIRLEQQLKIFQDTQDEKIDDYKKERKDLERKMDQLKRQSEESKKEGLTAHEKVNRLESDNDHLKKEVRDLKRSIGTHSHHEPLHSKRESHKQSAYAYESKENKIDWVHRNVSAKKDEKEKTFERKSVEKRGDSAEKNWRMSNNAKSSKMMSVMNEKMIQEKTREERRKAIQSKFDYRR